MNIEINADEYPNLSINEIWVLKHCLELETTNANDIIKLYPVRKPKYDAIHKTIKKLMKDKYLHKRKKYSIILREKDIGYVKITKSINIKQYIRNINLKYSFNFELIAFSCKTKSLEEIQNKYKQYLIFSGSGFHDLNDRLINEIIDKYKFERV